MTMSARRKGAEQ
jgi:hypothetical protein